MEGNRIKLSLRCKTPVVHCELVPEENFRSLPELEKHKYFLSFKWYRLENESPSPKEEDDDSHQQEYDDTFCFVHKNELATLQCLTCLKLCIPSQESYFCSISCYLHSWSCHLQRHDEAAWTQDNVQEQVGTCDSLFDSIGQPIIRRSQFLIERDGQRWRKVGSSKSYTPVTRDVGHILRLDCVAVDSMSKCPLTPTSSILTEPTLDFPISNRRCIIPVFPSGGPSHAYEKSSFSSNIRVLSYNILAEIYAYQYLYSYCPEWALVWQYRREKLLQEIVSYDADIICLQEVQNDHLEDFFAPKLQKLGYSVVYKRKTAYPLYTGVQAVLDGCATFFHRDKFKKIDNYEFEFDAAALKLIMEHFPEDMHRSCATRLKKGNIAIAVWLEFNQENPSAERLHRKSIIVVNTHMQANLMLSDTKLFQVSFLLQELQRLTASKNVPMVICGDFNSLPRSAPHDLILTGKINPCHKDLAVDPFEILKLIKLSHRMNLKSAYSTLLQMAEINDEQELLMNRSTQEPNFTNFTDKFIGTLDYIFYTVETLVVEGLLELEEPDSPLPNIHHPSDHLAIMACFTFK